MAMTVRIEFWDGPTLKYYNTWPLTDALTVESEEGLPLIMQRLPIKGEDYFLTGFKYTPILEKADR